MKRVIRVNTCKFCPYVQSFWPVSRIPSIVCAHRYGGLITMGDTAPSWKYEIPDWCPLEEIEDVE